ncbi:MAG: Holliday junction branch migration protein RuvA [Eubacterium sp.]|nr:Holliday junction branch migration protein RuvA [Eubacterium sp.]
MIAFVKGILDTLDENSIVVENNGIGYEILVPGSVIQALPQRGNEVKIFTYTHVREDALQLFGFLSRDGLEMFKLLIKVNGVGPKGALGILTALDTDALRFAIISDDSKAIARAPGIGSKTASKVILELKDKIAMEDVLPDDTGFDAAEAPDLSVRDSAIQALTALGYSSSQAVSAVRKVQQEGMSVEEILKQSLKVIM